MRTTSRLGAILFATLLGTGLALAAGSPASQPAAASQPSAGEKPGATPASAVAVLEAKSGSALKGSAHFSFSGGKVVMTLEVEGIAQGKHAVHLHEKGDCSDSEAKNAGAHWNPLGKEHGRFGEAQFHHGDIGNLEVGADGRGTLMFETALWRIGDGSPKDILGKSVIVHASPDDFTTQPTGNAGGRIGCGVVVAK